MRTLLCIGKELHKCFDKAFGLNQAHLWDFDRPENCLITYIFQKSKDSESSINW